MLTLIYLNEYSVAESAELLDWSAIENKGPGSPGQKEAPEDSWENSPPRDNMKSSKKHLDKIEASADCGLP